MILYKHRLFMCVGFPEGLKIALSIPDVVIVVKVSGITMPIRRCTLIGSFYKSSCILNFIRLMNYYELFKLVTDVLT